MKATEIMKLMEMLKTFPPKEDKMRSRRRPPPYRYENDFDIAALLHKKLEEADTLKKLLEDREKAHKKEDKKDDKKSLSTEQLAIFLVMSYPIIGLLIWIALRR